MTESEQTQHLADELDKLVERFRQEYEVTYASVVGVLHMKALLLCLESKQQPPPPSPQPPFVGDENDE